MKYKNRFLRKWLFVQPSRYGSGQLLKFIPGGILHAECS